MGPLLTVSSLAGKGVSVAEFYYRLNPPNGLNGMIKRPTRLFGAHAEVNEI